MEENHYTVCYHSANFHNKTTSGIARFNFYAWFDLSKYVGRHQFHMSEVEYDGQLQPRNRLTDIIIHFDWYYYILHYLNENSIWINDVWVPFSVVLTKLYWQTQKKNNSQDLETQSAVWMYSLNPYLLIYLFFNVMSKHTMLLFFFYS